MILITEKSIKLIIVSLAILSSIPLFVEKVKADRIGDNSLNLLSVNPNLPLTPLQSNTYIVKPGDYLYKIALEVYGDGSQASIAKIANANGITPPYLIYPGQVLIIPQ